MAFVTWLGIFLAPNLNEMSPRSLLFSSDPEASLVVGQVLRAIGLELEQCPEIFSAVEQLTAHSFDLIVADLDDGAEAEFLLKTSRDLSSNRDALRIAISTKKATTAAGVDLVLPKPLVQDRVRSVLLKSESFLERLKTWHPGPVTETPRLQLDPETPVLSPRVAEAAKPEVAPVVPLAETSSARFQREASGAKMDASVGWRTQRRLENQSPLQGHLRTPTRRPPPSRSSIVRQVILGVVLLLVGYVGIRPARGEAMVTSVAVIYAKAVQSANSWLRPAPVVEETDDDPIEIPDHDFRKLPVTRINVKPSPAIPFLGEVTVGVTEAPAPGVSTPPAETAMQIPDSLKHPFTAGDAAQPDTERPSRSATPLADLMEPVALPENQSQKLLLQKVLPSYPEQALKSGLQGPVTLQARIGPDGKIEDLKLVSGSLVLGEAASAAVRQWRYKPYLLNGHAVETQTNITVDFRLPQMVSTAVPAQ